MYYYVYLNFAGFSKHLKYVIIICLVVSLFIFFCSSLECLCIAYLGWSGVPLVGFSTILFFQVFFSPYSAFNNSCYCDGVIAFKPFFVAYSFRHFIVWILKFYSIQLSYFIIYVAKQGALIWSYDTGSMHIQYVTVIQASVHARNMLWHAIYWSNRLNRP